MGIEDKRVLRDGLIAKFYEYQQALTDWIENPNPINLKRLRRIDSEYKDLNSKLWNDIGI